VLLPFCRTHASIDTPRREPWSYGADYERANRAAIRLRYRLLPALYTAFWQHTRSGTPVVRPVFWDGLDDAAALATEDEYLLGDHLLVAPVLDSAAADRAVYLPRGVWYRVGSDDRLEGGQRARVTAPGALADGGDTTGLRGLPVFARAGAVIPMQAALEYTGERRLDTLELHVYPGAATSVLYEDAGEGFEYRRGEYRRTTFRTSASSTQLGLTLDRDGSYAGAAVYAVTMHDAPSAGVVSVDGRAVAADYDAAARRLRFVMPAGARRVDVRR
jgi:alpha-glucosidase